MSRRFPRSKTFVPRLQPVRVSCLAAQSLGLAAIWRTGPAALDPLVKEFLGLENDQHLVAFLYIGYPAKPSALPERPDFSDRTTWLDS